MFRRLILNTAISTLVFVAVSVIGLLLVPLLIARYGLAGFGLITLARLFVPSGVLGLLDFGVSEVATQIVARSRQNGAWAIAGGQLTLLAIGSLAIGLLAGASLILASGSLTVLFHVPEHWADAFARVLTITGLCLPLLFVALVSEGLLKGFEMYGPTRLMELGGTVTYAGITLWVLHARLPFEAVCLGFLAGQVLRAILGMIVAAFVSRRSELLRLSRWDAASAREVWDRCRLMVYGRLIGSLQGQAPALLVASLVGPTGAGAYDVLTRLPKFLKSIFGLLNSTLLPVAVRLDTAGDREGARRMTRLGWLLLVLLTFPGVGAAMTFSREILGLWAGSQVIDLWPWLTLMFVVPALLALESFGKTIVMYKLDVARQLNRVTTVQVAIQISLSVALASMLAERAFVLGQVVAVAATFLITMRTVERAQDIRLPVLKTLACRPGWPASTRSLC
jgi:O-antigen/teichoic acid export membrane protein